MTIFGTIYYKIGEKTTDFSGLQSFVSITFMGMLYLAVLVMILAIPNIYEERAVFYRERASFLYGSEVYPVALFLVELPWLWFNVWCGTTVRVPFAFYFVALFTFWFVPTRSSISCADLLRTHPCTFSSSSSSG